MAMKKTERGHLKRAGSSAKQSWFATREYAADEIAAPVKPNKSKNAKQQRAKAQTKASIRKWGKKASDPKVQAEVRRRLKDGLNTAPHLPV